MGAEISPVKAPSLVQETFWPPMVMCVDLAASAAAEIAVYGDATTISQCVDCATSGVKAEKKARVSAMVLYIFQLPAITRRRIRFSSCQNSLMDNAETLRTPRFRREEWLSFVG